jgi:outer membrane protein
LKQNTKLSLKKGRQLEADQTLQTRCFNFQSQAQANGQGGLRKRTELQREQLSYAQQALSQQLQQESGTEMDTLVSGVKNSSKLTVKKRIRLYLWNWRCFYFVC